MAKREAHIDVTLVMGDVLPAGLDAVAEQYEKLAAHYRKAAQELRGNSAFRPKPDVDES